MHVCGKPEYLERTHKGTRRRCTLIHMLQKKALKFLKASRLLGTR